MRAPSLQMAMKTMRAPASTGFPDNRSRVQVSVKHAASPEAAGSHDYSLELVSSCASVLMASAVQSCELWVVFLLGVNEQLNLPGLLHMAILSYYPMCE